MSFARAAILSVALAATTVGILYLTGAIHILSDDDRPPVVVSGGSVFIEQQVDAKDEDRGKFKEIDGDKKKWSAWHDKGKKPKFFTVIIDNSTTGTPLECPNSVHTGIKSLTFGFEPKIGGLDTFTAQIGPAADGDLELQFLFPADAKQVPGEEFRLELENVTLKTVKVGTMAPCGLGPRGRVEIRQRN